MRAKGNLSFTGGANVTQIALPVGIPLLTPTTVGDYDVPSGYNAAFINDITITGAVTVPSGSTLVILNGTAP